MKYTLSIFAVFISLFASSRFIYANYSDTNEVGQFQYEFRYPTDQMIESQNLYERLGVPNFASIVNVAYAHKLLRAKYINSSSKADKDRMALIDSAFGTLSNRSYRNAYNLGLQLSMISDAEVVNCQGECSFMDEIKKYSERKSEEEKAILEKSDPNSNDYFARLGIDVTSDLSKVKFAYRILAKKYHPDRQTDFEEAAKSQEILKKINIAKDAIEASIKGLGQFNSSKNISLLDVYYKNINYHNYIIETANSLLALYKDTLQSELNNDSLVIKYLTTPNVGWALPILPYVFLSKAFPDMSTLTSLPMSVGVVVILLKLVQNDKYSKESKGIWKTWDLAFRTLESPVPLQSNQEFVRYIQIFDIIEALIAGAPWHASSPTKFTKYDSQRLKVYLMLSQQSPEISAAWLYRYLKGSSILIKDSFLEDSIRTNSKHWKETFETLKQKIHHAEIPVDESIIENFQSLSKIYSTNGPIKGGYFSLKLGLTYSCNRVFSYLSK